MQWQTFFLVDHVYGRPSLKAFFLLASVSGVNCAWKQRLSVKFPFCVVRQISFWIVRFFIEILNWRCLSTLWQLHSWLSISRRCCGFAKNPARLRYLKIDDDSSLSNCCGQRWPFKCEVKMALVITLSPSDYSGDQETIFRTYGNGAKSRDFITRHYVNFGLCCFIKQT